LTSQLHTMEIISTKIITQIIYIHSEMNRITYKITTQIVNLIII